MGGLSFLCKLIIRETNLFNFEIIREIRVFLQDPSGPRRRRLVPEEHGRGGGGPPEGERRGVDRGRPGEFFDRFGTKIVAKIVLFI